MLYVGDKTTPTNPSVRIMAHLYRMANDGEGSWW